MPGVGSLHLINKQKQLNPRQGIEFGCNPSYVCVKTSALSICKGNKRLSSENKIDLKCWLYKPGQPRIHRELFTQFTKEND